MLYMPIFLLVLLYIARLILTRPPVHRQVGVGDPPGVALRRDRIQVARQLAAAAGAELYNSLTGEATDVAANPAAEGGVLFRSAMRDRTNEANRKAKALETAMILRSLAELAYGESVVAEEELVAAISLAGLVKVRTCLRRVW